MSTYQATYNASSRLHRSPTAKLSYSPSNWKNYVVSDFIPQKDNRTSRDSFSQRALSPSNSINQMNYQNTNVFD